MDITLTDYYNMLNTLITLRDRPIKPKEGICSQFKGRERWIWQYHRMSWLRVWDGYSGNVVFPVPNVRRAPKDVDTPEGWEYESCLMAETLWDGRYGELRMELVLHLISMVRIHINRLKARALCNLPK